MHIRAFHIADESAVIALWQRCNLLRPWNDPHKDIQRKLGVNPEWFLVGELNGEIITSVVAGYEGHRGWLNYLAVAPEYQNSGLGRAIIAKAESLLHAVGCPKINLQVRSCNHEAIEFYKNLGYVIDDLVSMGKRLEHDDTYTNK